MTDLIKQLDADIPREAVEERDGGGRKLSYLSGAYVINRLNEVIGQGKWSYKTYALTKVFEGQVEQRSGSVFATSYTAMVELTASIDGQLVAFLDVGYGDGTDRANPGKAHELAVKEAVTDGIKRAAKNLGRSMGLGLYFKGGEYIAEEPTIETPKAAPKTVAKSQSKAKQVIKLGFETLVARKETNKDEFKAKYLSGQKVDDLSDTQAVEIVNKLKADFPAVFA